MLVNIGDSEFGNLVVRWREQDKKFVAVRLKSNKKLFAMTHGFFQHMEKVLENMKLKLFIRAQ